MAEPLHIQGGGYIDVCAIDGAWQAVYRQGADVVCVRDGLQRWTVRLDILQIRCANDDAGNVLAVGQHHVTGKLTLVHEGRLVDGDWGHAGGVNAVACAFLDNRWHTWQMDSGTSYIHRSFQRDTLIQLAIEHVDISDLFPDPDGTSQGITYIFDGRPVFTDRRRTLKDAGGQVVLTLPNPADTVFKADLWIGQGGRGLAAFDEATNVLQTVAEVFAGEPRIARLGPDDFVACCRTLTDAVVVTFSLPLVQDVIPDLPVTDPGRPFFIGLFHHHYDYTLHPTWGRLELQSSLDVVSDPIAPIWPSLIGPDAIRVAPNDQHLVQGLFVSVEGVGPEFVERQITLVRELWTTRHPGADIPPVVVYLTEGQRLAYGNLWANATSADLWAPECYFDLTFPAEPVNAVAQERLAWLSALGQRRPLLPVCQAFDRNGAHVAHMGTVAHLLPEYLTEWSSALKCKGLLFFDCNRSGLTNYLELKRQYDRIASVCTPPAQLHPWTPAPNPDAPPRIAVRASQTQVRTGDIVTLSIEALFGSGPLHASVEWFVDEIGDGQGPGHHSTTTEFTLRVTFPAPGQYRFSAKVLGPGGEDTSDESDSPLITVEPAEEPDMPLPNEHEHQNFLVQLHAQGYQKYLKRERGIFIGGGPITDPTTGAAIDDLAIAFWDGVVFPGYYQRAPANAKPNRLDWAMRHTIRDIKNHPDAPPDSPPLPEEWNESFDGPPLLPSSR